MADEKEEVLRFDKLKSVMIGRLPRKKEGDKADEYKTASIKLYTVNNPHKTTEFPIKELEFPNIEKIRIRHLNVSYYLEGNDIIINDLDEFKIVKKGSKLVVRGFQTDVEERGKAIK